jgi:Resolvase, N terminal domain
MTAPVRASLYLRVSTGRQADNDLSIPDQRRQAKGYCASRGWEIVADYVEPGVSATDDRRPEFQRMIDAASTKLPARFAWDLQKQAFPRGGMLGSSTVGRTKPNAKDSKCATLGKRLPYSPSPAISAAPDKRSPGGCDCRATTG